MFKKLFFFPLCAATLFNMAKSQDSLIQITDMLKIKSIRNLNWHNTEAKLVFTVTSIEEDTKNKLNHKYLNRLYFIDKNHPTPTVLTNNSNSANQPAWSPDGSQIVFVRTVDGKPQLFILNMYGGEARQLTNFKYGAVNPIWHPKGHKILFNASIPLEDLILDSSLNPKKLLPSWSFEKPGFDNNTFFNSPKNQENPNGNIQQIQDYLKLDIKDEKAVVLNKLDFQNESSISDEFEIVKLFEVELKESSTPSLIGQFDFNDYFNPSYLPNGNAIICQGTAELNLHPDRNLESKILFIDLQNNTTKLILGQKGKSFTNPELSPSGELLAFQFGPTLQVKIDTLAYISLNNITDIKLIDFDRPKSNIQWANNNDYIYFVAATGGGNPLHRYQLNTKKIEVLSKVDAGVLDYKIAGDYVYLSQTQLSNPCELYLFNSSTKTSISLSQFNNWVNAKKLSYPQKFEYKTNDGFTIDYWVMKPTMSIENKKYPLLVEVHGGPAAMWGPGEFSMWHEYQYFCSRGYGIVYSNPRGSGGYGVKFLRGNLNNWGEGPMKDVLGCVSKTVKNDWVDSNQLFITGGSYGGYLVSWIIGHNQQFKAACCQRGVYDLTTFFGEGNAWRLIPMYFGGYPWDENVKPLLQKESPIQYVNNIYTPLIIFHGAQDRRTGTTQSEMLYRSLKVLNRPVEYVLHPKATHEITRSGENRQRIDQMLRTFEFFERWRNTKN